MMHWILLNTSSGTDMNTIHTEGLVPGVISPELHGNYWAGCVTVTLCPCFAGDKQSDAFLWWTLTAGELPGIIENTVGCNYDDC